MNMEDNVALVGGECVVLKHEGGILDKEVSLDAKRTMIMWTSIKENKSTGVDNGDSQWNFSINLINMNASNNYS